MSNSDVARGDVVVERRQHLLEDLLDGHRRAPPFVLAELVDHVAALADAEAAQGVLDLLEQPPGAELDDVVALRVAVLGDDVDDERVAVVGGTSLDRHEVGHRPLMLLEVLADDLLGHLDLGLRHLELRPVGRLGVRLNRELRREAPVLVVGGRKVVVVARLLHRLDARARGGAPEPVADVGLDRLGIDAVAADALHEDRHRHLALTETRDAHR